MIGSPKASRRRRRLAALAGVAVAVPTVLLATQTSASASADALGSCSYPYVCVYTSNGTKVGQFQDVTSGWQSFSRNDITQAKNTRNNDVVYFRYSNHYTSCVENNNESPLTIPNYGWVTGLQINDSDTCYQGSGPPPA